MRKAVIITPTYNEAGNIEKLIPLIFKHTEKLPDWEIHVLVVDSNSPDKTGDIVNKLISKYPRLHLLRMEKEGLGKAYSQGFQFAIEKLFPYLLFEMDADLSHAPKEIPNFIQAIEQGADLVIGSRYIKGGSIPNEWAIHRRIFSIFGNLVVRLGFMKPSIFDWTGGYRSIKTWVIKDALHHIKNYSGYVFQIALLDYAIKSGAKIKEIPIQFEDRKIGKSKINSTQFIVNIFTYIFLYSPFIKFVIVGLVGFFIDFGISYVFIEKFRSTVWFGTLISTEVAIISNFLLNNFWSFSHKKLENKFRSYIPNFIKFNLVSSGSILIQTIGVQLAVNFFGRELWYIYKIFIIVFIIIPYSYVFY
ncbi:glycosyltransferase family 2 protein, partial [Candidatus Roizmanbacteria bacterium]|nr:glycosyltransferase family 2 protein [Candidatus Roizmanbacteria bacterium]